MGKWFTVCSAFGLTDKIEKEIQEAEISHVANQGDI